MPNLNAIPPILQKEVEALGAALNARFTPPELYMGCKVLDITDKDEYATNNGWIECLVAQHNQQRCRWRGQVPGIAADDFVDVMYFASYRLFVVFGQGGVAAVSTPATTDNIPMSGIVNGRLTLTSGTPITTTDVTAATTVYFAPYSGYEIGLYDGADWGIHTFTEVSVSVPATTDTNYDVFAYDSSGLTLEAVAWTNDTTRATALALQDGVYVKTGATGRRYVGSFRTTGVSGQTEDSDTSRFVYNHYNRVMRHLVLINITSHTYTTASWRAWNNDAANSQVEVLVGLAQNALGVYRSNQTGSGSGFGVGFGLNTTGGPSGIKGEQFNNIQDAASSDYFSLVTGYNYWGGVEYGASGPTFERISITMLVEM